MTPNLKRNLLRRWARLIRQDVERLERDAATQRALDERATPFATADLSEIRELAIVEAEKLDARGRG